MPVCSSLFAWLLVSQIGGSPSTGVTAAPPPPNPPGQAVPAATYPGTPAIGGALIREPAAVRTGAVSPSAAPPRATAAQLLADALSLPPGSTIVGQPVSLASVVATAPERSRQIEAVHAYWRLAEALGDYHLSHERQQRLARLPAAKDEAADLRTAQAIAAAQIREAEVQVTTAQHDLAEILLLAPGTPLPLPADQPLVGPYRTLFAEMFAGKTAPQRARMLDQTLPLRNRAVESHAAALLAAEDALDAAIELQTGGQGRLANVIAALDVQVRQQRAFLAAVCRYNHDIADYALVVVAPQTTPEVLVGTLIKPNRPAGLPVASLPSTATLPATFQQPISAVGVLGSIGVTPAIPNRPTRAPRPGAAAGQTPGSVGVPPASPVVAPPDPLPNDESQEPRLAPPQESAIPLVPDKPLGPTTHSSRKPISDRPQASAAESYSALAALTPAERTVRLTAALYGVRDLPYVGRPSLAVGISTAAWEGRPTLVAQSLPLIDCLRTAPANSRAKVIEAYWTARQIAAQYQSFVEQIQWLEALGPTLFARNPLSPTAMLKLRTARLAVEAERADAKADWTVAQFDLAGLAGLGTEKTLPQPISVPFVGRLPLLPASSRSVGVPPASSAHSWSRLRLESTIPQRHQTIIAQAAAAVQSDASRTAATADFLAGRSNVERVLAGIEVQARETSAFLRAVSEYNRAIAQYATATFPPNIEAEKLVAALGAGSWEQGAGSE